MQSNLVQADHIQSASTTLFKRIFKNFHILVEKYDRNWSYVKKLLCKTSTTRDRDVKIIDSYRL